MHKDHILLGKLVGHCNRGNSAGDRDQDVYESTPELVCAQAPAIACSIADSAASALAPSGPPACAMSGRPPPPLPPSASEPLRTSSTALKREVRSEVTPTTMPALPSSVTPTIATTPEPICFLPSSTRLLRSLVSTPSIARAS